MDRTEGLFLEELKMKMIGMHDGTIDLIPIALVCITDQ